MVGGHYNINKPSPTQVFRFWRRSIFKKDGVFRKNFMHTLFIHLCKVLSFLNHMLIVGDFFNEDVTIIFVFPPYPSFSFVQFSHRQRSRRFTSFGFEKSPIKVSISLKETLHKCISLCHLPFGQVSRKNLHF